MDSLEVILPLCILVLAFILKLVVDRVADLPKCISAVFELPVDIAFLATSLIAAYTIASPANTKAGLVNFIVYIIGAIVVVLLWRRSEDLFAIKKHYRLAGAVALLSYVICSVGLVRAITLVSKVVQ